MSNAYIIEVSHRTAGIVVKEVRGVRFFSSDTAFTSIDGGLFASARAAEFAARMIIEGRADQVRQ